MFSFSHIAIVFLIALLVFGPEKLPEVARIVGKALGDFRRASTDFRRVIEDEFAEIDRQNREKE
ncbi:MAG TPA: twin-arginine translocase TatA/TatE family subunit, partial [Candidatus Binatia bacterium]|nr:twin-arginine translocase TatA/TatE family subunit [Candidatus Binatia bacterium]